MLLSLTSRSQALLWALDSLFQGIFMHAITVPPRTPPCLLCETDSAPALKAITFYCESNFQLWKLPFLVWRHFKSNISQMLLLISLSPSISPCTASPPALNSAFTISIKSNANHQIQAKNLRSHSWLFPLLYDYQIILSLPTQIYIWNIYCTFTCLNPQLLETLVFPPPHLVWSLFCIQNPEWSFINIKSKFLLIPTKAFPKPYSRIF